MSFTISGNSMATRLKFPCITNTSKALPYIYQCLRAFSHTRQHTMGDNQSWEDLRKGGAKLKKKFDDEKKNRPERKIEQ